MRKAVAVLAALVMLAVVRNAWGQDQYTVIDLGTLGGAGSVATGINNGGQIVGWAQTSGGINDIFLDSGGTMTDLGTYGGESRVSINNSGQVAGPGLTASGETHAFLYGGGTATDLGTLGGIGSWADGINNIGQVVGWTQQTAQDASGNRHAFLYSGSGPMLDLGTTFDGSHGNDSLSDAINDSGQIVGCTIDDSHGHYAYLCSGGSTQYLGALGGLWSSATSINNSGLVVGYAQTASDEYHAFLYSGSGPMQDLGTLSGGTYSCASAINNSGLVVGDAYTSSGTDHAFLYDGSGSIEDLNNLIPFNSGWTLDAAYGINDSGQIVGYGVNPQGQQDAFLLNPVPEPTTLALLGVGAVGLLGYRLRRNRENA